MASKFLTKIFMRQFIDEGGKKKKRKEILRQEKPPLTPSIP